MSTETTVATCQHCGVEVRTINYALGAELRHSPYPHHPRNSYRHCKQTVATVAPLAGQHTTDEEAARG